MTKSPAGVRRAGAVIAFAIFVAACTQTANPVASERAPAPTVTVAPTSTPSPSVEPTPTMSPAPTATVRPTVTPLPTATPAPTATPLPTATPRPQGPCGVGALMLPNPLRPTYDVELLIDPATRSVDGRASIVFSPDLAVDEVWLRLWPNGPRPRLGGVSLSVDALTLDGVAVDYETPDPTSVRIELDTMLAAGESVTIGLDFDLVVPSALRSRLSGADDYLRLGTIVPLVPWEPGRGWALDPPTSLFAESVSSPVADWAVRIVVPEGFEVLASGVDDGTGTWRVDAARDFALTVGRFRTVQAEALAPEPVVVTVGVHERLVDDEQAYLDKVVAALEQFSQRFGQYPWPSLTFALTPDLRGGIEFPTHIMQGPDTLGRTTSHEVAHMWFYSLVGNNQGTEPWLDEGITSYAEFTFEGTAANSWEIPAQGIGQATQPMTFWEPQAENYYRGVYSQTGFALQNLGERGDVDCALARYVAENAHQIATATDFVAAFEPVFPDIVERMATLGVVIETPESSE